jgi:peroxiredoxin
MIESDHPSNSPTRTAHPVKLSVLRGKRVILYFYPKADT